MMFNNNNKVPASQPQVPSAADVALIDGNLTQVFVHGMSAAEIDIYLNGEPLQPGALESLTIEIIAPSDQSPEGSISAILSTNQTSGARTLQLFPGTIDIIARGRRLVVTCQQANSFEGLVLEVGLKADGTSSELSGVQSLRLAVSPGLLDARIVWSEDGRTEDLLPEH